MTTTIDTTISGALPGLDERPLCSAALELQLPGLMRFGRLANGLHFGVLHNEDSELVATSLWYRVGSRHEREGEFGLAHFLEHMMFRGTRLFGPGEVDRRTQRLGGFNEAFTSHDATCYGFQFSNECWSEAIAMEADRMTNLVVDPALFDLERQVILEEIAMAESEPWDVLERAVMKRFYEQDPYGRSVLGTRRSLSQVTPSSMEEFYHRHYRPDNAFLAVAGGVNFEDACEVIADAFQSPAEPSPLSGIGADRSAASHSSASPQASESSAPATSSLGTAPSGVQRVTIERGELPRLLVALPAPVSGSADAARLELLLASVASARSSRLNLRLVEEQRLCSWIDIESTESQGRNVCTIAAEALPNVTLERLERALFDELQDWSAHPVTDAELALGAQSLRSDWLFGHERVANQAETMGTGAALFGPFHSERSHSMAISADRASVVDFTHRWLNAGALDVDVGPDSIEGLVDRSRASLPSGSVIGWAIPVAGEESFDDESDDE